MFVNWVPVSFGPFKAQMKSRQWRSWHMEGECTNATAVPQLNSEWPSFSVSISAKYRYVFNLWNIHFLRDLKVIHKNDLFTWCFCILICNVRSLLILYLQNFWIFGHRHKALLGAVARVYRNQEAWGGGLCNCKVYAVPFPNSVQIAPAYLTLCWILHSRVGKRIKLQAEPIFVFV